MNFFLNSLACAPDAIASHTMNNKMPDDTSLPGPPVSPDVDLKDFPFTPMYRARLFGSSFHARATDAEWRAGLTLWLKSQDQVPAGSLPADDIDLCRLAELGRDMKTWRKVKDGALHGWYKCADGRLYHNVVAEVVNWQWEQRQAQRDRTEAARAARAAKRLSQTTGGSVTEGEAALSQTQKSPVTGPVTGSKGREVKGTEGSSIGFPPESEREESVAAEGKSQDLADPVVRPCGPPPQAPSPSRLENKIKNQFRQKLMRYCNARMGADQRQAALMGLMGEDANHDAQWWLDEIDRKRKREGWDDTREWKREHLGAAQ